MKIIGRICYTIDREFYTDDYLKTTDETSGLCAALFGLTVHREICGKGFVGVDGEKREAHIHLVYEFSSDEVRPYYKKALKALADHFRFERYFYDTYFDFLNSF